MVECLAPITCRFSVKVRTCCPNILNRTLNTIGTIVERTLTEQVPCFLNHSIVLTVACNSIVVDPLSYIGLLSIHPRQLEYEVVGDGSLLDSLRSSTDTLDAGILSFELEIIVGHILQASHQT